MTTPVPVLRAALAVLVLAWPTATFPAGPARTVAITFDDLPFMGYGLALKGIQDETTRLLSALKRHRVPAIGFVNEDKLEVAGEVDARVALLQGWLDTGMELGNHGYAVAPFTVEDSDYVFAKAYADARRAGNTTLAERVRAAYLDHQDAMFAFYETEARDLFDRDIPQILLIHANELNARAMEDVLARLRRRGYAFISLDAALRDEAYRSADGYVGPIGPSWLHRWRTGRGGDVTAALRREPDAPGWVVGLVQPRERP
jgi:peptidoglycan/xylan/chitin deacetylase (PgdA/CDA1 family)